MTSLLLRCTACDANNVFPRAHENLLQRASVVTLCHTCAGITTQMILGQSTERSADDGGDGDDALWRRMESAVGRGGASSVDELRHADESRRRVIFSAAGFSTQDQARLLQIARRMWGPPVTDTSAFGLHGNAARAGPQMGSMSPAAAASPNSLGAASPQPREMVAPKVGGRRSARCSVYPDLPAEYWCSACSCLVSSRCHVTGVHKDHPFVTLRAAAERHVQDLLGWSERSHTQLGLFQQILGNISHARVALERSAERQVEEVETFMIQIYNELASWKETVIADVKRKTASEVAGLELVGEQVRQLNDTYERELQAIDPLLSHIPPLQGSTSAESDDWSLQLLDAVTSIRRTPGDVITLPKLVAPRVHCGLTPTTKQQLLYVVTEPMAAKLPDVVDPSFLAYPNPTSAHASMSLVLPEAANARGVAVVGARTLTRLREAPVGHCLVRASAVFFSGSHEWEVVVDRTAEGRGRVLIGVVVGAVGAEEGVVFDGRRVIGPGEGDPLVVHDEGFTSGSVVRVELRLDENPPTVSFNLQGKRVATISLPLQGQGWAPALSVYSASDQVTILPAKSAPARVAPPLPTTISEPPASTVADVSRKVASQENVIAALQQQLRSVQMQLEVERSHRMSSERPETSTTGGSFAFPTGGQPSRTSEAATPLDTPSMAARAVPPPGVSFASADAPPIHAEGAGGGKSLYSAELLQLMRFVEDIKR